MRTTSRRRNRRMRVNSYLAAFALSLSLILLTFALYGLNLVIKTATFSTTSKYYASWWKIVDTKFYHGQLSKHDKAVVEKCAERVGISPEKVLITLLHDSRVPNFSHRDGYSPSELDRFDRMDRVYNYFGSFHRGVAYRLTHGGASSPWQLALGAGDGTSKQTIKKFEHLTKNAQISINER